MNIIGIHIFPHEIDEYVRVLTKIKKSLFFCDTNEIMIYSTLNLNELLLIKKEHTDAINKFKKINNQFNIRIEYKIETDINFLGVNELRRLLINKCNITDNLYFLDTDLHFNTKYLSYLIRYTNLQKKKQKYFIISPQCVRLWDQTWDCLVNDTFLCENFNFHTTIDPNKITNKIYGDIYLKKISVFKWAGGWFNGYSTHLLKKINIPTSFKGYGPDDTFMMYCCDFLKSKKRNISQYVISGFVVCEDKKLNYSSNFLKNKPNHREICNQHIKAEFRKFIKNNTV